MPKINLKSKMNKYSSATSNRTWDVIFKSKKYISIYYNIIINNVLFSELKKLSEESLTRQPEEVFDIICKLGEG